MYAVLFDLDDTLYPELSYVKSGFRAVAEYLTSDLGLRERLADRMLELFLESPTNVLQRLIESEETTAELKLEKESVQRLVEVYREHSPQIELYSDVLPILEALRKSCIKLGIITDGRADGQMTKISALQLTPYFDVIIATDSLGPDRMYWKPHTYPYIVALKQLQVRPDQAVYVGDNPTKDFQGAIQLGMRAVQIRRPDALRLFEKTTTANYALACAERVVNDLWEFLCLLQQWSWLPD